MQNPEPPTNWVPHRSIYGGAAVGGFVATLVIPFVIPFYPKSVDASQITIAITGLCCFIAGYLIPDTTNR